MKVLILIRLHLNEIVCLSSPKWMFKHYKQWFNDKGYHFFFLRELHLIWPNICMAPPPPFLPTIHRIYIYLQKVCYKLSFSNKYSYFAFNSINSRSEYGILYHFHGMFLFIYQMVLEQACARPLLVQTFGKHPFSAPKH